MLRRASVAPRAPRPSRAVPQAPLLRAAAARINAIGFPSRQASTAAGLAQAASIALGGPGAVKKEPKVKQRKPSSPIIEMDPNEPAHPMPKHVVEALRLYEAEQAVVPDPLANPLGTGAVNLPVIDWNGNKFPSVVASSYVFDAAPRADVIHSVVKYILAKRRLGTASTKGRSEVRGGGKKPWGQKKTGRARAGSIRSPLWKGGGKVHTPKPRDFSFSLPKKLRQLAMRAAISIKRKSGRLVVLDNVRIRTHKSRDFRTMLERLQWNSPYFLTGLMSPKNLDLASRNLRNVDIATMANFNVYDIMRHDILVLSRSAVGLLDRMLAPPTSRVKPESLKGPVDQAKVAALDAEKKRLAEERKTKRNTDKAAAAEAKGIKLKPKRSRKVVPSEPLTPPTLLPPAPEPAPAK